MTDKLPAAKSPETRIWKLWFQHLEKRQFNPGGPIISAADQIAFYEIAQPIISAHAQAAREPLEQRIAELEGEVERLNQQWESLVDYSEAAKADLRDEITTARCEAMEECCRVVKGVRGPVQRWCTQGELNAFEEGFHQAKKACAAAIRAKNIKTFEDAER